MLCQGDEDYGVGSVLKMYADAMPELSFVALGDGQLVEWLRARGRQVDVVPGLMKFDEAGPSILTLMKYPRLLAQARRDAARIDALLRPRGVRIVHAHWRPQQIIGAFLRQYGYRSIWHVHNNMNRKRLLGLGRKLNHRLARWGADLMIPVSGYIGENWRGSGVPVAVVHNAAPAIFAEPNQLPDGTIRCLVAGRLHHEKGAHVAVEAVIRARQQGLDFQLDLIGGPLEGNAYVNALRQRVDHAHCSEAIRFFGFQPDVRRRHQEYHLGLQCRISPEPCSMWVCETLVDGLPLVAAAAGGTPELVVDGVTGLLVPAGEVGALTHALTEMAADRPRLQSMRVAAFQRGAEMFTTERFAQDTLRAYQFLLSKPPTR
jgi:glycosyltransferase involved in cell wall biosynthesis